MNRLKQIFLSGAAAFAVSHAVLLAGPVSVSAEDAQILAPTTDFTKAEPLEHLPGGAATTKKTLNRNAFSQSSANLPFDRELNFKVGNGIFKRIWVSAPASTASADGLGPLYNARACQRCHLKDGRGHPPAGNYPEDTAVSMFLRLSIPPETDEQRSLLAARKMDVVPEPTYGTQLQDTAIPGIDAEGKMHIEYEEIAVELSGGEVANLRKPTYSVTHLGYGPLHPKTLLSPRLAPQMIGLGLLEAIDEQDILAHADPDDADGDGISGRPNRVWSPELNRVALGRFGHKAGAPSLNHQNQGAFNGDIGLSTPLFPRPSGECTEAEATCLAAPNGNTESQGNLEVGQELIDLLLFYTRNLAVPARRNVDDPTVLRGKQVFYETGCISCHTPKFKTAAAAQQPELSGQLIWPYADLLLHDMGEGLADHRPESAASGTEWRTAPLWGIGVTETVSGHTFFLHDGRARSLLEAVLWHGGEAEAQKQAVVDMPPDDRAALISFLESL